MLHSQHIIYKEINLATKKSSAQKRHEQSEVRRIHNKAIKTLCRTRAKQFLLAVKAKNGEEAFAKLKVLVKDLDKARSKGVLKSNAVSRKKSRMMKLYHISFVAQKTQAK